MIMVKNQFIWLLKPIRYILVDLLKCNANVNIEVDF